MDGIIDIKPAPLMVINCSRGFTLDFYMLEGYKKSRNLFAMNKKTKGI